MQTRAEITDLVNAINEESPGNSIRLREDEFAQLETVLRGHPEVWPIGLVDTFTLLQQKLRWKSIDRQIIPDSLLGFFDEKFRRDLDPMSLARNIGQDICRACSDGGCRC
jgi:hypothetical protein